ncbi:MAG: hypothetical protein PHZ00_06195 [Candidatus Peribacteraceae bacterium]|nr:hypothetical protein [Candidatus Peribacteraceae bacterium]
MTNQYLGIIIGGLLPALLYSVTGIFSKVSNQAGIGVGPYLIIIGLAIALTGGGFLLFQPDMTVNWKSGSAAIGIGLTWGIGSGLIALALVKYRAPLSQIVPLYNLNTLIVVLLSLWIFSEWKDVSALKLVVGSALIVAGGTLVSVA